MDIKEGSALPAPSDARIEWFEKSYRVKLPADYVDFLRSSNGATPVANAFDFNGEDRIIESFLPLLDNPSADEENGWRDISVVITQLDERLVSDEDQVGMDVIPIAALFAGDFLCLDFRENPQAPVVAIWDHELSEEFIPELVPIAETFSEFLSFLY